MRVHLPTKFKYIYKFIGTKLLIIKNYDFKLYPY